MTPEAEAQWRQRFPHQPDERDQKCTECGCRRAMGWDWNMYPPCWVGIAKRLSAQEAVSDVGTRMYTERYGVFP